MTVYKCKGCDLLITGNPYEYQQAFYCRPCRRRSPCTNCGAKNRNEYYWCDSFKCGRIAGCNNCCPTHDKLKKIRCACGTKYCSRCMFGRCESCGNSICINCSEDGECLDCSYYSE